MVNETKKKTDPLFHVVKRTDMTFKKSVLIRAIAILAALFTCAIFVMITGEENNGLLPFVLIASLFKGSFGNLDTFWVMLKNTAILLGLGLALIPAFKMKFWNTGADGQALVGAIACYLVMYGLQNKAPDFVIIILGLLAAVAAGIVWGVIPAIFKAFWNTNETLFTLMMNYVAIQLVAFFVNTYGKDNKLPRVEAGNLPMLYQYLSVVLIVGLLLAFITVYLKKSKHGYEVAITGESENTAKYAGINVKWVIIRTMILSGAICGLIGFIIASGLSQTVSTTTLGGRGFTAIIVVWLAGFNPLYMALTAFFVVFIQQGGSYFLMETMCTNSAISSIITSIFFFFIIGCTFFINYRLVFRKKENEDNAEEVKDNKEDVVEEAKAETITEEIVEEPKEEIVAESKDEPVEEIKEVVEEVEE